MEVNNNNAEYDDLKSINSERRRSIASGTQRESLREKLTEQHYLTGSGLA